MASTVTLNTYKTDVIGLETSGLMDDITDSQFVYLLNQAIINRHAELTRDCPSVYQKNATLTFSSAAQEVSLPSDADTDSSRSVCIFSDTNRNVLLESEMYRLFGGSVRFITEQPSGQNYYIEYIAEPSEYDPDSALSGQTLAESVSRKAKKYIAYEILRLYFDGIQNAEVSSAGQNRLSQANRIA